MIYLNNAATSYPKPEPVLEGIAARAADVVVEWTRVGSEERGDDPLTDCRKALAGLFKVENHCRIIFTSGATESLNMAIFGLELNQDHVISTVTEHNSVLRPLKLLESQGRITLSLAPSDDSGFVHPVDIQALIRPETRVVIVNHCSNVTGARQNLPAIGKICRVAGCLFIVDAAQSAGSFDIDILRDGIDMVAFTGHKNLGGIAGSGGLYIGERVRLEPLKVGGTGIKSDLLVQPPGFPIHYECGTPNHIGICAMRDGIEFIQKTGMQQIHDQVTTLIKRLYDGLKDLPNIQIYGCSAIESGGHLFTLNISGLDPADLGYILLHSFGIMTRAGLHCAPLIHQALGSYPAGSVRISPSYFTTVTEIDQVVEAVTIIAKNYQ